MQYVYLPAGRHVVEVSRAHVVARGVKLDYAWIEGIVVESSVADRIGQTTALYVWSDTDRCWQPAVGDRVRLETYTKKSRSAGRDVFITSFVPGEGVLQ